MWRYLAGGLAMLLLVAAGFVFSNSRARPGAPLPPMPARLAQASGDDAALPDSVPEASARTREQKRFDRYDKDRNGDVTREEYLASRRKAYAKLDANHDGALSFDEWAAKTQAKFAVADGDKSGAMSAAEFATTAVKRTMRTRANCQPVAPKQEDDS